MSKKKSKIHIGTSGWHYGHWEKTFYPQDAKKEDFLKYYIKHFDTVEINNSFYQLPRIKTLEDWKNTTPDRFIFSVKGSRYITHMKKLKDPKKSTNKFLKIVDALEKKAGPILFQLPPKWGCNAERLDSFLKKLPRKFRYAFELRDPDWFNNDIYNILKKHDAAFCMYDFNRRLSPKAITTDFIYIRLHGPDGAYKGKYNKKFLSGWAGAFFAWIKKVDNIYCYFDNDQNGYAAHNAAELRQMINEG